MAKTTIKRDGWRCDRCAHEWAPMRAVVPTICPKCKSPYWNKPRQTSKAKP